MRNFRCLKLFTAEDEVAMRPSLRDGMAVLDGGQNIFVVVMCPSRVYLEDILYHAIPSNLGMETIGRGAFSRCALR